VERRDCLKPGAPRNRVGGAESRRDGGDRPGSAKDGSFLALLERNEPFPVVDRKRYGQGMSKQQLSALATVAAAAALMAMVWISTALAEADGDGDGFDGDELSLPILLGVGVVVYVGWLLYRRWSARTRQ
jgi:hypothetical protein